ncbi:MAG: hypothetical protein NZ821_06905 [Gloeomargarita sp. SKYB31]|nr:hypothetical protein [Gloeomargarita sp. SKYB31]
MNAQVWLDSQDYAGLIAEAERLLDQEPGAITAWGYGGLAYLLQDDPESAQAWWFRAMTDLTASQLDALAQWLETQAPAYRETQPAVSLGLYQAAQEIAPTPERLCRWIEFSAQQDQLTAEALETLIQALQTATAFPAQPLYQTLITVVSHIQYSPLIEQLVQVCREHLPAPVYAEALLLASNRLQWQNALEVREQLLNLALEADPENVEILGVLASLYGDIHQHDKALELCDRQMAAAQKHSLVTQGYALYCRLRELLNAGGVAWSEILAKTESYRQLLQDIADPNTDFRPAFKLLGANLFHIPFLLPYLRDEPAQDRPLINRITSRVGRGFRRITPNLNPSTATPQRLRIGFLSLTLRRHSVGWLARSFFQHYDREQFEFFLYYIAQPPDDLGQCWFVQKCDHYFYHDHPGQLAEQIARDGIQILVDMDSLTLTSSCVVLAQKPAPIQVTWLGWDASGLDTVDYFIADPLVLPANAQDYYQETLWRLPETYIAVDGFEIDVPTLRREDLGIAPDAVIFYTAQSGYKRHPDTVDLQLQILRAVPNSYLCVKYIYDSEGLKHQFVTQAQALGVDPKRLRFLPPVDSEYVHRANLQNLADVVLDTYPYNGATTTLEALWLGVPMVTRVGQQFAARNSYAFLTQCGITEGIAHTPEDYVAWGVRLGTDTQLRQHIRQRLLESRHTSPLWNGKRFARQLGEAFQQMWQCYVNKHLSSS